MSKILGFTGLLLINCLWRFEDYKIQLQQ